MTNHWMNYILMVQCVRCLGKGEVLLKAWTIFHYNCLYVYIHLSVPKILPFEPYSSNQQTNQRTDLWCIVQFYYIECH